MSIYMLILLLRNAVYVVRVDSMMRVPAFLMFDLALLGTSPDLALLLLVVAPHIFKYFAYWHIPSVKFSNLYLFHSSSSCTGRPFTLVS